MLLRPLVQLSMPEMSGLNISHLSSLIKSCFFVSMMMAIISIIYHHLDSTWKRSRKKPQLEKDHIIY